MKQLHYFILLVRAVMCNYLKFSTITELNNPLFELVKIVYETSLILALILFNPV